MFDRFEACTTPLEYALAITEVVNGLHDTHAYVRNSVLSTFTGTHVPPVKLRTIGNQTIVVQVEQLGLNDEPKEMQVLRAYQDILLHVTN